MGQGAGRGQGGGGGAGLRGGLAWMARDGGGAAGIGGLGDGDRRRQGHHASSVDARFARPACTPCVRGTCMHGDAQRSCMGVRSNRRVAALRASIAPWHLVPPVLAVACKPRCCGGCQPMRSTRMQSACVGAHIPTCHSTAQHWFQTGSSPPQDELAQADGRQPAHCMPPDPARVATALTYPRMMAGSIRHWVRPHCSSSSALPAA